MLPHNEILNQTAQRRLKIGIVSSGRYGTRKAESRCTQALSFRTLVSSLANHQVPATTGHQLCCQNGLVDNEEIIRGANRIAEDLVSWVAAVSISAVVRSR